MEKNEFVKKARILGYTEDEINEILSEREEMKKNGLNPLPLEAELIEFAKDQEGER